MCVCILARPQGLCLKAHTGRCEDGGQHTGAGVGKLPEHLEAGSAGKHLSELRGPGSGEESGAHNALKVESVILVHGLEGEGRTK